MRRLSTTRPSPALVISVIALVFAVGGGSFAVGKVGQPSKQGVAAATKSGGASSSDKKSDKKIAAGQVKALVPRIVTGLAHGLSVRHAATADTATNAGHASSADTATSVGGLTAVKIYAAQPPGTATTSILSKNGFTVTMACDASGHVTLTLITASDPAGGSQATSQGNNDTTGQFTHEDETNSGSSSVELTGNPAAETDGGSQFGGAVASGASISGMIQFKPADETYATHACVAEGHAFIG